MTMAVYIPAVVSVVLALAAPRLALRGSPSVATWTTSITASVSAVAFTWSLLLFAATLVDEAVPSTHEHVRLVAEAAPNTDVVGGFATVLLVVGGVRLVRVLRSSRATYRRLREVCAASGSDLVVLADPVPQAFAAPGAGGHVVVSTGMLAALSPAERRVLLAHERAHLRGGHHWHTGVVRAAAAVNPLLGALSGTSTYLCERWADETAATAVGNRRLAATALARAALAATAAPRGPALGPDQQGGFRPAGGLGYHHEGVAGRIAALQRAPAPPRTTAYLALLVLVSAAVAADVEATAEFVRMIAGLTGH
jgi:beta-lactamase regulating signal transducer with metallopeptidase domain